MKRRNFLATAGAGVAGAAWIPGRVCGVNNSSALRWTRTAKELLFSQVHADGEPLNRVPGSSVLDACCLLPDGQNGFLKVNPDDAAASPGKYQLRANLRHRLLKSGFQPGEEDLLEATLVVNNLGPSSRNVLVQFVSAVHASANFSGQRLYIPVSAAGLFRDERHAPLGSLDFVTDCDQAVGSAAFACHYLEPLASNPAVRKTKALLLAPVIDSCYPHTTWRTTLFTDSAIAAEFRQSDGEGGIPRWTVQQQVNLKPGEKKEIRCFLLIHQGDSLTAWKSFHAFGHREQGKVPEWLREVRVHYYDFLSSAHGEHGHRGDGYEADLPFFEAFRVGMATQHGYYPSIGDFIQPGRSSWQAMRGDKNGSVAMSFQKMKDRIAATRAAGAHAAVYMHTLCFDDASTLFGKLKDSIMVDAQGRPIPYPWSNVDTAGSNWFMSFASADWRNHLLKQTEYIMEILDPDAIVLDETFLCLGYEEHPDRKGPLSQHSMEVIRQMRALIHSYGKDKALLTSDCSMAGMVLWADGEAGDHSYPNLLGNPLYRKMPIRFQAPLWEKPWIPCSWHFIQMWEPQMDLARKIKTGVGVANGYIEFNGLKGLPADVSKAIQKDIRSLF